MRRSMVFLFAFLMLASCNMTSDYIKYDKSFDLSYGKCVSTRNGMVSVCFDSVISESRCPDGAMCVWAGEAIARFRIRIDGDYKTVDLSTYLKKDTLMHGYKFMFINLSPYPSIDKQIRPKDYTARIMVREE